MDQVDADRVGEFRKCIECFLCVRTSATFCVTTTCMPISSARASWSTLRRWRCSRWIPRIASPILKNKHGIGLCNITKCCKVCPEHITDL